MSDQSHHAHVREQVRARALHTLGPMLPLARQWFAGELAGGTPPQAAAEALGFVLSHMAAGVAAATPQIERQVVDWLTWQTRNDALALLAVAVPRNIVRGPGP